MDRRLDVPGSETAGDLHHFGTSPTGAAGQVLMLPRGATMKRTARLRWSALIILLMLPAGAFLMLPASVRAADLKFPPLTGRVVDDAGVLSASTIGELDQMLA